MMLSEEGCPPEFLQVASENKSIPHEKNFIEWFNKITQFTVIKPENITIRLVGKVESQALNQQFRGKDCPTNVLSFPSQLPADIDADYLGDLVICAPVVEREAREQNKTSNAHWAHMLVHGILHLKGYDHIQAAQAREMERLEKEILVDMGFSDPYAESV
jgi:probable rRNA maturation factor